jgi:hypothetical protein
MPCFYWTVVLPVALAVTHVPQLRTAHGPHPVSGTGLTGLSLTKPAAKAVRRRVIIALPAVGGLA